MKQYLIVVLICISLTFFSHLMSFDIREIQFIFNICSFFSFFFLFCFLRLHPQHMEVPRLGVKSELPATATVTPDPNRICHLHRSSQQCQILNPLSRARDQTCILMDTGCVPYCWATTETPECNILVEWKNCFQILKWHHYCEKEKVDAY